MLVDPCVDPVAKQWNEGSTKKNTLSLLPVFKHNGSTARDRQSFINFNPVHGQGILCSWPVQCHNVDRTVRLSSMGDLRHGNRGSGNTTPEAPEPYTPYAVQPMSVPKQGTQCGMSHMLHAKGATMWWGKHSVGEAFWDFVQVQRCGHFIKFSLRPDLRLVM